MGKSDRRSVFKFQLNSGGRGRGCLLLARNIKILDGQWKNILICPKKNMIISPKIFLVLLYQLF
jgi:hypothetical protein